jgi:hypothetical protein
MNPSPRLRLLACAFISLASFFTASNLHANLLANGDMTLGQTQPSNWDQRWVGTGRITTFRDQAIFKSAPASLRLTAQDGSAKGQIVQQISTIPGERLAASGWIKCEGADTTAQIALQFFNDSGAPIGFSQIRFVSGNTDWTEGRLTATAPAGAARVGFVILLDGDGQAWLDDAVIVRAGEAAAVPPPAITMSESAPATAAANLAGEGTLIAAIANFRTQNFNYGYEGWKTLANVTQRTAEGLLLTAPAAGGAGIVYGSPADISGATHVRLRYLVNSGHTASSLLLKFMGSPEGSVSINVRSDGSSGLQTRLVPLPERRPQRVTQVQFQGSFNPAENFNLTLIDAAFVRKD